MHARGDDTPPTSVREVTATTALDARAAAARPRRLLGHEVQTPRDAMRLDELQSTRLFLIAGCAIAVLVLAALPFLDADRVATSVLLAAIALAGAALGYAGLALRAPGGYRTRHALALALAAGVAGFAGIYFFGVLSAASLVTAMAVFFFALTHDLAPAAVAYAGAAVGPLALWLLFAGGVAEDRGIVAMTELSRATQATLVLLMEAVFGISYLFARGTRRARLATVKDLDGAVRQIAQREALLDEARRELDQALRVGGPGRFTDQVLGSFRLGVLAGRGAIGEVYEALHTGTRQPAAVKLLSRGQLGDPEQVRRFFREASIAATLETPHVVTVIEVADPGAPLPYIAMELLRGEDLAQMLRRQRRLTVSEAARLLRQVGLGLDVAHAAGVVHRDIKPQNLFAQEQPDAAPLWKILDFGVSRLISTAGTLTQGQAIGTPSYMAPEQARGQAVDHRADLFSLGIIAYRCVVGRPAFAGRDIPTILHNVVYTVPPRPSEVADIPPDLDYALAIALAKRREDRYDSAAELANAFAAAAELRLSEDLRIRGRRVIARYPWGNTLS